MSACAKLSNFENKPTLLRRRFIPSETVALTSDELLLSSNSLLITKWQTIRPKPEFASGVSYYFFNENYKISRFYSHSGKFLYWYCDIIEIDYDEHTDTFLFSDLLLDIKLYPNGRTELLDEDELEEALSRALITPAQYETAKSTAAGLLDDIRNNIFPPAICLDTQYW